MSKMINMVAKIGLKSATCAGKAKSWFACYQKQEPVGLKKFIK